MVEGFEERLDLIGGSEGRKGRFVLVFDGIDQQRDAPPTLLPALARLGEIVSLCSIFLENFSRGHARTLTYNIRSHTSQPYL
jgi:hypothetical protein